jgi:SPP1 family predicted phage head-tail adaptor
MVPGSLRQRIELQSRTDTQDATGQAVPTWATYATVWAAIEPLTGRELIAAKQAQSQDTVKVRCRYLTGILTTHRVLFGTRILAINAVINLDERNRELNLMCTEPT